MRIGIAVTCVECGLTKQPHGRDSRETAGLCTNACPGYYLDPQAGCLWPGETEEDFAYPCTHASVEKKPPLGVVGSHEEDGDA